MAILDLNSTRKFISFHSLPLPIKLNFNSSFLPSSNREQSRICKFELFNRFKQLCSLFEKDDLTNLTYYEVKSKVVKYNELKHVFFDYLKHKKYGPWVCKPMETKVFK